jgi:hypothetical protein
MALGNLGRYIKTYAQAFGSAVKKPETAWENMTTRGAGAYLAGQGTWGALGAMFLPQRTWSGSFWYGIPKAYAEGKTIYNEPLATTQPAPTTQQTTTPYRTATTGTTPIYTEPAYAYWMGVRYDLNDPDQAEAYANARRAFIEEQYGTQTEKARKSVEEQLGTYGENLLKTLQDLGLAKQKRDVGIMTYFSAIAPSMYQSAEQEAGKESEGLYGEAKSEAEKQAETGKKTLSDWWEDYQRTIAQQKQQELDQLYNALTETESEAVKQRIMQEMQPYNQPTYTPINVADYFNRLGQAIGTLPAQRATQLTQPVRTSLLKIINKLNQGIALTPEENQIAVSYGIIG